MPRVKLIAVIVVAFMARCAAANTVWIDTDVAIGSPIRDVDDAYALVFAMHSPETRIAGISTSYGNSSLAHSTRAAREVVGQDGKRAGVFAGAASRENLGKRTDATDALAAALKKERLVYVALGPITNLATFIELHPDLAARIERVVFLGGQAEGARLAFGPKDSFRIHDANVFKDPTALAKLLQSKIPLTLVPISKALKLQLNGDDLRRLERSNLSARYLARHSKVWLWFWRTIVGEEGGPIFDVGAVVAATKPELVSLERRNAAMNERGELIVPREMRRNGRPVRFVTGFSEKTKRIVVRGLMQ